MSNFRPFEIQVLRLLAAPVIGEDLVRLVVEQSTLEGYRYTGCGYFLTVAHPDLAEERIVCSTPFVVGRSESYRSGFLIFIQAHKLTLECHNLEDVNVPEDFRDRSVTVEILEG